MKNTFRYEQLEQQLAKHITSGRYALGQKLPSIRTLCADHKAAKATVIHALQRLEARGLIESRPRSGFYACLPPQAPRPPLTTPQLSDPAPVTTHHLLRDIMQSHGAFDLSPSNPPATNGPSDTTPLNRALTRSLRHHHNHPSYDEPAGQLPLRKQLATHYARRGLHIDPNKLCITSGCQNAILLALMACCQPGDIVAVESPGFYGVLQLLEQLGMQAIEVPASIQTGINPEVLETLLARWPIRACIVSPTFGTPGGSVLPASAQQRLLKLAQQHDFALIEDDIYADTAFSTPPEPLKSLDSDGRVILCSAFSKSLSPDLRIGWISGGQWHDKIVQLKLVTQLASSQFIQHGLADFMKNGAHLTLFRKRRHQLKTQRDALIEHLQNWSPEIKFSVPEGGLALWLELPDTIDTIALYPLAKKQGIMIMPGPLFSATGQFRHCMRLSYAQPWNPQRREALTNLKALIKF